MLGLRQEMVVVELCRLEPTRFHICGQNDFVSTKRELKDSQKSSHLRTELGGVPPLSVTLKSNEMATAIIRRAGVCRGTQLQVNMNSASSRQYDV